MSILQGAKNVTISGGTQIVVASAGAVTVNQDSQGTSSVKELSTAAAHAALHDSFMRFDAPRCHRKTRSAYLDALESWMLGNGEEYTAIRLIWLTGGAGAGKSAIMQTIVEKCSQYPVILGCFFFSRTDVSRNNAEVFIPTLAYQLARVYPATMAVLEPCIQQNPLIFKASLLTQAYELLVRPLLHLTRTGVIGTTKPLRKVFVIDGLDECEHPQKQAQVIQVIATILRDYAIPVSFLIASRPEMAISRALQRESGIHCTLASITLDDDTGASSDIRQFIEDSFLDVLDTHPLRAYIPSNWPPRRSIDRLVWKSSRHFVYAATVMKYISSADEHPARALQVVEGVAPSRMGNPFADLDALYLHILSSAKYSSQILGILRHCVLTALDNSVRAICFMYPNNSPEDVALFLSDVQALVSLSPDHTGEVWVCLNHASLSDILMDANRSRAIYMSKEQYKASLLPRYFRLLDNGSQMPSRSLFSGRGGDHLLIRELIDVVRHLQDVELLRSLISGHSPRDIWNFCMQCWRYHTSESPNRPRDFALGSVSLYVQTIRDSAANHDSSIYIQQFMLFNQVLMEDFDNLIRSEGSQYRIIPALIFSSSPACLTDLVPSLLDRFLSSQLHIKVLYTGYFWCLRPVGSDKCVTDPRSFDAIKQLNHKRLSWSSELTTALEYALQHLVGYPWTPEYIYPNPHARWLHQKKPSKQTSLGSPRLSSTFHLNLRRLMTTRRLEGGPAILKRYGYSSERARSIWNRKEQCLVLPRTVICYLRKCDRTSKLAKLARKSLPKATLWSPGLMKKARVEMDVYVHHWEESLDGLLERSLSLLINEMD